MKRPLSVFVIPLILGLITGCAILQKKDEPPPLPPIEETKPPLTMKGKYFEAFPWDDLAKPRKDGNDPDTLTYTVKEGDTAESVAESMMGNAGLAKGLLAYNELPRLSQGDKIVIPNPIIGISSQMLVKAKGKKEFGEPQTFTTDFKTGDEYKLRFVSNVDGYLYVFREGSKGVAVLFPTAAKKGKRNKGSETLPRDPGRVRANDPIELPIGKKGYVYDPKKAGKIYVFLSLRENSDLAELKEKKALKEPDLKGIMRGVKEAEVFSLDPPYHLLRITDPKELLGFSLNISG